MVNVNARFSHKGLASHSLKGLFIELIQRGKEALNASQGLLVSIEQDSASVLVEQPTHEQSNFKLVQSFSLSESPVSDFPLAGAPCSEELRQCFADYVGTTKLICGRFHAIDGVIVCFAFTDISHSSARNVTTLSLLDDSLSISLEKSLIEKAQSTQLALFQKLQSVANIGTWEVDLLNNAINWSSQTKVIHEVPNDYVPSLDSAIGFYKEGYDRDEITRIVSHAMETGESWCATLQLVTAKNNPVWIETHGMAEMENGKCVRLFGTFQNVDKSVALRLEIEEKQKAAEEASAERGILLSRISHELKTPLNGITGMLQSFKRGGNEAVRLKKVDVALQSADRLLGFIDDVLDYTSIVNGDFSLKTSRFCIRSLIEELSEAFKLRCTAKGIKFLSVLAFDEHTHVEGDPVRISQILSNLLSNAIKYTDTGYVALHVTVKHHTNVPVFLASVEDSGIGMDEGVLSSIFKPLLTHTHSFSEGLNGKGLGLSIVKQLVDKMEGEIEVRSNVGIGSVFDVVIPIDMPDIKGTSEQEDETDWLTLPLNVLIVDDNDINRFVLASMLEKFDYVVDEAENGAIAIDKARDKKYDIIFMDCAMPVLDGLSATKVILHEGLLPKHGRIVAVTANTSPEDKASCSEAGMADFLAKPIVQNDVTMQVKQTVSTKMVMV